MPDICRAHAGIVEALKRLTAHVKAAKELNFGEPAILICVQLVRSIQRTQENLSNT
jgi:hypothetical protein